MAWYYAAGGQQIGPVEDAAFDQLVRQGSISSITLVWRHGMPNWLPLSQVVQSAGYDGPAAGMAACTQCGRYMSEEDVIRYDGHVVCAQCKPLFFQRLREGAAPATISAYGVAAAGVQYAGFWIRFAARFIDGLILNVVSGILGFVVGFAFAASAVRGSRNDVGLTVVMAQVVATLLSIMVAATYETIFVGRWGATVGKMACGIKIVLADGSRVTYIRAFSRYFATLLSSLTLMIGYIIAGFDDQKRALHDHICNTRVVRK
jgi:uncharacterized RDD family membrane protein YckC